MYHKYLVHFVEEFWIPFIGYLSLLGVLFIILGIGLAGLVSVLRSNERKPMDLADSSPSPEQDKNSR
jgi:hypothetical protein